MQEKTSVMTMKTADKQPSCENLAVFVLLFNFQLYGISSCAFTANFPLFSHSQNSLLLVTTSNVF